VAPPVAPVLLLVPDELPFDVPGLFGLVLDPLDIGVLSLFFAFSRAMHASRSAAGTLAQTFCASRSRLAGWDAAPAPVAGAVTGDGSGVAPGALLGGFVYCALADIAVPRAAAISACFHSVFMDFTPYDR
jgi:hypothetical protein